MAAGLSNGSFETPVTEFGTFYSTAPPEFDWTIASGNIEVLSTAYWQASSGSQSIDLNGASAGSIYQDFTFSSSGVWAIRFDMSANPDLGSRGDGAGTGLRTMRVDFGTPGLMTTLGTYSLDSDSRAIDNMNYVTFMTPAVAVSDSVIYRLQFTSLSSGLGGPVLDNVLLVPEPSTWALFCVGAIVCLLRWRNRIF